MKPPPCHGGDDGFKSRIGCILYWFGGVRRAAPVMVLKTNGTLEYGNRHLTPPQKKRKIIMEARDSNYKSHQGNLGLGIAIAYYTSRCIPISIPLNDTQGYDLIIDNGGLKRV